MEITVEVKRTKPRLGHRVLAQAGLEDLGRMFIYAYQGDLYIGFQDKKGDIYHVSMTSVVREIAMARQHEDVVDSVISKENEKGEA